MYLVMPLTWHWYLSQYKIKICKDYACEFDIMFNSKKSKLMCYNMLLDTMHIIKLCNELVQVVDSEVYLG